ncbi:MAG: 3-dehydroquinate synthase [Candidatus Omnitrophota bacterium]
MKEIILNLKDRGYSIVIADSFFFLSGYLKKLGMGNYACVITNAKIKRLLEKQIVSCLKEADVESRFLLVKDSEESKSLEIASNIIEKILQVDQKKKVFIIALGGGVIGDLAGFTAAVYKRGIPFIQIPTTLLAQVDSSIGGKTAVDVKQAKNIIGAFYQPKLVYSNIAALKTLPRKEITSGLAEIIKYAMIKDKVLFGLLEKEMETLLNGEEKILEEVIAVCSRIKADVVADDEYEKKGKRTILNFGHTFGHAIEAAASYSKKYSHGQAVAIGMLMACDLSVMLGICSEKITAKLERLIKIAGLPVSVQGVKLTDAIAAMRHDKKFISGKNRFVLPVSIGKVKVVENISEEKIKAAFSGRFKDV